MHWGKDCLINSLGVNFRATCANTDSECFIFNMSCFCQFCVSWCQSYIIIWMNCYFKRFIYVYTPNDRNWETISTDTKNWVFISRSLFSTESFSHSLKENYINKYKNIKSFKEHSIFISIPCLFLNIRISWLKFMLFGNKIIDRITHRTVHIAA